MNLSKNTNTTLHFSSVSEIPENIWEELQCKNNLYFHPKYLISLEKNNPQITFYYLVLLDSNKIPTAFASIQIIDFPIAGIENSLNKNFYQLKCFGRQLGIFPSLKPLKILVCGNIFVSGEHGIYIKENQNKQTVIKEIAKAIATFTNSEKNLVRDISIILIKDFIKESLQISDELHDLNYHSFNVEPNMALTIDEKWYTFQDYLDSMKTKFRIKAKRALQLSSDLLIKDSSGDDLTSILPEITQLYKTVSDKADFNLGDFNPKTYQSLKSEFGNQYIFKTYWYRDKIVGFMSAIINTNSLDAHFVGIDYQQNKELAIYQRMLYDYVQIAINNQLKVINFGRTASEIKSSIGAVPQELTCYIRHKKSIANKFMKPFFNYIEPKPFKLQNPFKSKSLSH